MMNKFAVGIVDIDLFDKNHLTMNTIDSNAFVVVFRVALDHQRGKHAFDDYFQFPKILTIHLALHKYFDPKTKRKKSRKNFSTKNFFTFQ